MPTVQHMPRRAFLKGAVPLTLAAPLAAFACAPDLASAPADTPIAVLFREWADLWTWLNTTDEALTWSDEEHEAHFAVLGEIEDRMEAKPVQSVTDIALKFAAITGFGSITVPDEFDREVYAFLVARGA